MAKLVPFALMLLAFVGLAATFVVLWVAIAVVQWATKAGASSR